MPWWRRNKPEKGEYSQAEPFRSLREQLLGLDPAQVGLSREEECGEVWGMLVETAMAEAVATVVVIADGTVSVYWSTGGASMGLGGIDEVRLAGEALLLASPRSLASCQPTTKYPLPRLAHCRFYLLTFDGVFTAEAHEDDLDENREPLSELFRKTQDLTTQIGRAQRAAGR